jgi:outer membrane protein assembly factor BamD (BamD/ComL family)
MRTFHWIVAVLIITGLAGCGSRDKDLEKIKTMEKEVFNLQTGMDKEKAAELIRLYENFADNHSKDTAAPACLYKAAELSINLNDGEGAIRLFDRVIKEYPDFYKVPEAMFLKGFVYEVTFRNTEFLKKYPDNEFAKDAKSSIDNLGKTPEQIIMEATNARNKAIEDSLAAAGQPPDNKN